MFKTQEEHRAVVQRQTRNVKSTQISYLYPKRKENSFSINQSNSHFFRLISEQPDSLPVNLHRVINKTAALDLYMRW